MSGIVFPFQDFPMRPRRHSISGFFALVASFFPAAAQASCGAAFCPVNTQWNTQGMWTEPGWRADLRYEYVPQSQPRAGSHRVSVGAIPHHHDEAKTFNHNVLATLDYGFASGWGVTVMAPLVNRSHSHIHNHMGGQFLEQWDFTELGDAQLLGRYQFPQEESPYAFGINFGVKLPTGRTGVKNSDGDEAERSLQPGTGTTDIIAGPYVRRNLPELNSSWFAQALWQQAANERDGYRPGKKLSADLGYRYDVTPRLSLMLQLNGQVKWRDSGRNAEPADSGGRSLSASPGISYGITEAAQLYGFIQKPLYQYVNGVQLTPEWSAVTGISLHF